MDDETDDMASGQSGKSAKAGVTLRALEGETPEQGAARVTLAPELQTVITIEQAVRGNVDGLLIDVASMMDELTKQSEAVSRGDLKRGEAMLAEQAHTLHVLFNTLARRSMSNTAAGYLDAGDRYMRLALRAQNACRATWDTIAEIKNPRPVAFVKQANVAGGHMQVNNARAGESAPIELNGGRDALDAGIPPQAVGVDPGLAALGTIHGAAHARGQGQGEPECVPGRRAPDAARAGAAAAKD